MGNLDGMNKIHHSDEFHEKRENINMHGKSIDNLKTICMNDQRTNLKYCINMECLLNFSYTHLCETIFWEKYQQAIALYKIDTSNSHEVNFDQTTRKVTILFNQSLSQSSATQTSANLKPTISTKANRVNNRYYLEFNGSQRMISDIDLNPASGEEDIVNIFSVCKISQFGGSYWARCGRFGHDNSFFDKFVSFSPSGDLIVSATTNDHIAIGQNATNGRTPIAPYKTMANAGELDKWICLSIHWNLPIETSYVYCNGKKLCEYTSRSSVGSTQLTFGDINPSGIAPFFGNISCFLLYKNRRISERDIELRHHVLCSKWYNIDHDPITF